MIVLICFIVPHYRLIVFGSKSHTQNPPESVADSPIVTALGKKKMTKRNSWIHCPVHKIEEGCLHSAGCMMAKIWSHFHLGRFFNPSALMNLLMVTGSQEPLALG